MYEIIFLGVLAFIWILFATIQDLRFREVANWLNFSLIIFALGFRFFWCLFSEGGFGFFYQGLIGLGIFFILGNLFYYGRIFAGGDAKLMIALGAILPFTESFYFNLRIFIGFLFLFVFVGAVYGLLWSIYLAIKNKKSLTKNFPKNIRENKRLFYLAGVFSSLMFFFGFFNYLFFLVAIFVLFLPFSYFFAKTLEECCMIVKIPSSQLREGDWILEDIKLQNKTIKKDWEGISQADIKLIKGKVKFVKIKQGIAFVPVFLISFLILLYFWFFRREILFWLF